MKNFKDTFNLFKLKTIKYSPEILVAVGIVGVVGSAVMACKATLKLDDILEDGKTRMTTVHDAINDPEISDEDYTENDAKKDKTIVCVQTGLKVAKLYGPSIFLGAASIGCIVASATILKRRNVALAAAYKTIDMGYKKYRDRVADRYGDDAEKDIRYNIKAEKFDEVVEDEKGKRKKVKKAVDVSNIDEYSEYSRYFDSSSREWQKDADFNLNFLTITQNYCNDILRAKGYLFLNDVYNMLDIPITKAGQAVGWFYDPENTKASNCVNFGIFESKKAVNRDFVNGYENVILLDFNVDGNILDLI